MKQHLYKEFIDLKSRFIESIKQEIKQQKSIKFLIEYISLLEDSSIENTELITILEVVYKEDEDICLAHIYATDTETCEVIESWTPLDQLSFNELFKIAEHI